MSRIVHAILFAAAGAAGAQQAVTTDAPPSPATAWAAGLTVERVGDAPYVGRMNHHPEGGAIALGQVGPGTGTWYRIRSMDPATGAITVHGRRTVPDPDSVAWDTEGSFAPAGSILVGTIHGIYAVAPDGSVANVMPTGAWIDNPEDIRFDSDGNLIAANFRSRTLVRFDRDTRAPELLHTFAAGILQFDIARDGSFRVVDPAGGFRVIDEDGADRGVVGSRPLTGIAAGPGGVWGSDTYACDMRTGELLRIDRHGSAEVLFTGLFTGVQPVAGEVLPARVELSFSPTRELYVGVPDTGAVYRIAPDTCVRMDTNADGDLTPADFNAWIWCFIRSDLRADIDGDGMLLPGDFYAWVNGWHTCERRVWGRSWR